MAWTDRRRIGPALVTALALAGMLAAPAAAQDPSSPAAAPTAPSTTAPSTTAPAGSAPPAAPTDLRAQLDAVAAVSPADSCLSVRIDGEAPYDHRGDAPVAPASTEKLFTATVALDVLGGDATYRTSVVGSAPVDGIVDGDLTVVGGGDPVLVTDAYRLVRSIGDDQAQTRFDALADQLAAAGIKGVTGRIVGDESRYDALRTVPTWPARYADQEQAGPLSALDVDDGYVLTGGTGPDDPIDRSPSAAAAVDAATTLTRLLQARGIVVIGAPGAAVAPAGAAELAAVTSPPLSEIVGQMLRTSDNQIAELLLKELGRAAGGGGSTAAGAAEVERRLPDLIAATPGLDVVDGSGLDRTNRVSCQDLVGVLDATGGLDGSLGPLLPTAGETGTLAGRFRGSPAQGRLHAKTGSLGDVTALAGFVELPEGGTATFAYVANGDGAVAQGRAAEEVLGTVLAQYLAPCRDAPTAPLVAPVSPYAAQVGTLSMFPLQSVLLPGAILPLHVFEDRYRVLVERCLAEDEDFGVVLISRGSEVGGHDQRTDVGTRARIARAERAPDGRFAVLAVGIERLRVTGWRADDPHPVAEVEPWPDEDPTTDLDDRLERTRSRLRRVLALRAELGDPGPPATVDLRIDDPVLNGYLLIELSPLGPLDRYQLLATPDLATRLDRLDDALADAEEEAEARLAQA